MSAAFFQGAKIAAWPGPRRAGLIAGLARVRAWDALLSVSEAGPRMSASSRVNRLTSFGQFGFFLKPFGR